MVRKCLEVLDDRSEVELVARAGETSQTHSLEAMMDLQMRKAHLYFLALIARLRSLWSDYGRVTDTELDEYPPVGRFRF